MRGGVFVKSILVPILGSTPWEHLVPSVGNVGAEGWREKLAQVEVADRLEPLLGVTAAGGERERIL